MFVSVVTVVHVVWTWLPGITIGLKFCAALIGFAIAAPRLVRRIRRWLNRR